MTAENLQAEKGKKKRLSNPIGVAKHFCLYKNMSRIRGCSGEIYNFHNFLSLLRVSMNER